VRRRSPLPSSRRPPDPTRFRSGESRD